MGRRFEHSTEGETDVETLFALLSGPDWAQHVAARLGDDCTLVRRTAGPDGSVELVMTRKAERLPGFVAKLAPADVSIVTTDRWGAPVDGARHCTWTAEIPGTPTRIRGTQRIEPCAAGSRHLTSAEVTVPVPLVGGKVEAFIVDQIQRIALAEEQVVRDVLG